MTFFSDWETKELEKYLSEYSAETRLIIAEYIRKKALEELFRERNEK
jgi:hypothetical protein